MAKHTDTVELDRPPPQADWGSVSKETYSMTRWRCVLASGQDITVALEPGYWVPVLSKLQRGDLLSVFTSDFTAGFEAVIRDVADHAGVLVAGLRPLYPRDLDVPETLGEALPRYVARASGGYAGGPLYSVFDTATVPWRRVRSDLPRTTAALVAHEMNVTAEAAIDAVAVAAAKAPRRVARDLAQRASELAAAGG